MGTISQAFQAKRLVITALTVTLLAGCHSGYQNKLDVQGHRGARGLYPENTITGFVEALKLGVNTLELDVVMSRDGQVVVSHDPFLNHEICLDPAGNAIPKGKVFNLFRMDYDSIAHCDCGSIGHPRFPEQQKMAEKKPLLIDALKAITNYCRSNEVDLPRFNVEIKANPKYVHLYHPPIKEFADAVVHVLQSNLEKNQFTIQCFDGTTLQYVHRVYPDIELVFLQEGVGFKTSEAFDVDIKNLGFTPQVYSCQYTMLTQELVNHVHEKNMRVVPWTVNKTDDMQAMLNMRVDGMITDYPNRLLKILNR